MVCFLKFNQGKEEHISPSYKIIKPKTGLPNLVEQM
jgi:hypothetical protein